MLRAPAPFLLAFAFLACTPEAAPSGADASAPPPASASSRAAPTARALPPRPWKAAAIAHGGVGSPASEADGCRAAVDAALAVLEAGGDPVDAAVAGVVVMEDDPRYNAGTGSIVRIDGRSVQMDAAVMASDGRFGGIAGVEDVKNPVKVARAVLGTPHLLLAGDGATRFARALGMPRWDPTTDEARAAARRNQERLKRRDPSLPAAWRTFDWRPLWNFERTPEESGLGGGDEPGAVKPAGAKDGGSDTVGVAVRATDGRFAVALSTGGTSITLRGRVGDVPILGAGLYADEHGAAACTGTGERIIEAGLGRATVGWLAEGAAPDEAARRAVDRIRPKSDIGVIVIGPDAMTAAADRQMAWAAREAGSKEWRGP